MTLSRSIAALAMLVSMAGCVSAGDPRPPTAAAPRFDPIAFFAGSTHGTGTLHVVLSGRKATDVEGIGVVDRNGAITLRQTVSIDGGPRRSRVWHLRPTGGDRYAGTLSDARGPVVATARGDTLEIRFAMKHGLAVVQHLSLQAGGRVAINTMVVRKWGVVVARLDERIERL